MWKTLIDEYISIQLKIYLPYTLTEGYEKQKKSDFFNLFMCKTVDESSKYNSMLNVTE